MGMEKEMKALDDNVEFFFPLEILFEILSWLTVGSLLRCKCVCKRWKIIIQHPKFIEMHLLRSEEHCTSYYNSTYHTFNILDSNHGLLVEESKISRKFRVRNPATKQILALPDPNEKTTMMMIVFLESTSSYKLFSIHGIKDKYWDIGFEVLNFEGSDDLSWRTVDKPYFSRLDVKNSRIPVHLYDRFLCYCALSKNGSSGAEIHCLDVETESLRPNPIIVPRNFFSNWEKVELGKWDEKSVAFMKIVEDDLHVWVLEDLKSAKWAEKMIIIPLPFLKINPSLKELIRPYWATHEEIWFSNDDGNDVIYCNRSKQVWELQYTRPSGEKVMTYNGTLVTLKGMQPAKTHNTEDALEEFPTKLVKLVN